MPQRFKSIYFADHPGGTVQEKNLKLAFGTADERLYRMIQPLSSQQLREILGAASFAELRSNADSHRETINGYCVRRLRTLIDTVGRATRSEQGNCHPFIEPLQATFRGGKEEPLHDWYPYLEGYSPEFVERLLLQHAAEAAHVCDPFAGTGTTPLTVARLGRRAFFCELNPLLQFLIQAKVHAYNLSPVDRLRYFGELKLLSAMLSKRIEKPTPDQRLAASYQRVFGRSAFFTKSAFHDVLRLRTLLDDLACDDVILASFATVAVLSCLIPASLLIRRGDVRFKTEAELRRQQPAIIDLVAERLDRMAHDLLRVAPLTNVPVLLCSDARALRKVCPAEIDAVITSPPYLNGTNYFRNTKVELWFLRCLSTADDLAFFRRRAVTAGINDVTVGKPTAVGTPAVARLVESLAKNAYDARIPRMVQTYFHDLATVFDSLSLHLTSEAAVMIDIGDSTYGGVRVPTPALLEELLRHRGYELVREVVLRRRASRSGEPLSQVLLVLRGPGRPHAEAPRPKSGLSWWPRWRRFKSNLPHQQGERAKRNWGHPLHSLCSYQGKMKPSLAAELIQTFLPAPGAVLDPFGGVGTIPFEAALAGHRVWSFDISPAAVQIALAKLEPAVAEDCSAEIARLGNYLDGSDVSAKELQRATAIRFNGPLSDYFHPQTFVEILKARRYYLEHPPITSAESLVFSSLLHILHGNRPYALSRRSHPITPFAPTGPAEHRPMITRLRDKVERSLVESRPNTFVPGKSLLQDATETWPQDVDNLDAIITSPPFFDSTRFHLANWMRLWFCGWEANDFKQRPRAFVDERQKLSFEVYEPVLRQCRERLKPGGVVVFHLGRSKKCDMAEKLQATARPWFRVADTFHESVAHCESHGISDKGTVREHSYLILN